MKNIQELPTSIWHERLKGELLEVADGELDLEDLKFTEEMLLDISPFFQDFKNEISHLNGPDKREIVIDSVNGFIIKLNMLNDKYNYFIETTEREDICLWIDSIISQSGIELDSEVDLTEELRTW